MEDVLYGGCNIWRISYMEDVIYGGFNIWWTQCMENAMNGAAREAFWRRIFDPYAPLLFNLYHYLEQNLNFGLVPENQFWVSRGRY